MTQAIEYQGELAVEDFLSGYALHRRKARRTELGRALPILVGVPLGVVFALSHPPLATTLTVLAAVVILLFYGRWETRRRLRRSFAKNRSCLVTFHSRFDETGFRTTSAMYDDRRAWTDLVRWAEDQNYILLYEADYVFRTIPKRVLGDDTRVAQLRQLLTTHLGPAA